VGLIAHRRFTTPVAAREKGRGKRGQVCSVEKISLYRVTEAYKSRW
jgi:hypothetical protein